MDKRITVLGSTGSIGTQTLEVAKQLGIYVYGLTAGNNAALLEKQARQFGVRAVAIANSDLFKDLKNRLADTQIKVLAGQDGINEIACMFEDDIVVCGMSGINGLVPLINAIKHSKKIALANKEAIVSGGCIVNNELKNSNAQIIPIDSEHCAIFQCLKGNDINTVARILLTGSGGPFRGMSKQDLNNVKPKDALIHPNWRMGHKIMIDSATLMNKGLEVIEAYWLFGISIDKIKVVIHPQSIVHSMVEYVDGSVVAQLGARDMRLPIQFALTHPDRVSNNFNRIDIVDIGKLTFENPDTKTFSCMELAIQALKIGGSMPAAMNAANEKAVSLFLNEKIGFNDIPCIIEQSMTQHNAINAPSLHDILNIHREVTAQINWRYE